ncbi:hypothetical protein [Lysobacter silvisoli]|uniref:Secreted protein n=1 Tax=Lysobacter silvisoli TaxID=2293254 RepID=A0A371K5X5_9GAMM|nr:hypothetical protein [Lysobacter silvisoli]RDZ29247.1 hypothetical protein DX914_09215 [Lysobacter silvisoli]
MRISNNGRRSLAAAVCAAALLWVSSVAAAEYVDAASHLSSEAEIKAWYGLQHGLRENFDEICGDTFCEGDYSNIQSLRFRCSVDRFSGVLGQCLWLFAASNESVDPATGKVAARFQHWRCRSPLAPGTNVQALLGALAGERPLYAVLPGTGRSLYDGLVDCL